MTVNGEFLILLSSFGDTLGSRAHQSDAHLEQGQAPVEKAKQELRESDVPKAVVNLGCKAVKRVKWNVSFLISSFTSPLVGTDKYSIASIQPCDREEPTQMWLVPPFG